MAERTLRIGILGAAKIAPVALVKPAQAVDRVEVMAVAAREPERARAFATRWGIPNVLDSYAALVADERIDAVYNPLPNSLHAEWTIAALEAGKHVLCEKPLTSNAAEAREVAAVAERTGRVVLEAFHYRYHPLMEKACEIVQSGELGTLRWVESWFQIPLLQRSDIRYQVGLAGGSVMDLGCYSIHQLRSLTAQEPTVDRAEAKQAPPGIDRWMRADFSFPSGAGGRMTCSLLSAMPLRIAFRAIGDEGELRVVNPARPQAFHRFSVTARNAKRRETFEKASTYDLQLAAFVAAVLDGTPALTPLSDSIANMEVIDAVYRAAGMELRSS